MGYWKNKPFWKLLKFIHIEKLPFVFKEKLMWKLYRLEIKIPLRIFGYNTIEYVDKYSMFITHLDMILRPKHGQPLTKTGKKLLSSGIKAYLKN